MPLSSVLGASSVIKPGVCTSTTRPTVPYTGQLIFETDTSRLAVWTGSAWQYESAAEGPPGLVYLTGTAFTSQTSVAFPNSTFTSTYDYYIVMMDASADSTAANVSLQVRDNSGTKSAASYLGGGIGQLFNNTQSTFGVNGGTSFALMQVTINSSAPRCAFSITVANPASTTKQTKWHGTAVADPQSGASIGGWHFGGHYNVTESHTGLVFTFSNASSGLYRVYGMTNN